MSDLVRFAGGAPPPPPPPLPPGGRPGLKSVLPSADLAEIEEDSHNPMLNGMSSLFYLAILVMHRSNMFMKMVFFFLLRAPPEQVACRSRRRTSYRYLATESSCRRWSGANLATTAVVNAS